MPGSLLLIVALGVNPPGAHASALASDWPTLARWGDRRASLHHPRIGLDRTRWIATADERGRPLAFHPLASPVAFEDRALALAERDDDFVLAAFALEDGEALWSTIVPPPIFDSWSSPTIDPANRTVLVASDFYLSAYDLADGAPLWQTPLELDVVNATPVVTTDLGDADRAFITDSDVIGIDSRLYCVNVDPFDASANPYQPGEIVWSVPVGAAYGSTPAYHDGVVAIATAGPGGFGAGRILAFDATAHAPPPPLWTFTNVINEGFFGGLAIARDPRGRRCVFAASYAYGGRHFSANLVKVDLADGSLVWSVASNRSDSIPLVLGDGLIILAGGIHGFGSDPTVQAFLDEGDSAAQLWDSRLDTWDDLDGDGRVEPGEFLHIGGWPHQPLVITSGRTRLLYAGAIAPSPSQPATDFYQIDAKRLLFNPADPVTDHYHGAGSTPAAARGLLLSVGEAGLHAFGPGLGNAGGPPRRPAEGSVEAEGR